MMVHVFILIADTDTDFVFNTQVITCIAWRIVVVDAVYSQTIRIRKLMF